MIDGAEAGGLVGGTGCATRLLKVAVGKRKRKEGSIRKWSENTRLVCDVTKVFE